VDKNAADQATELSVNLVRDFDQLGRQIDAQIAPAPNSGNRLRPHQVKLLDELDRAIAGGCLHIMAQLQISSAGAREFMDRAPARYVETLTAGQVVGPKAGVNRIIIDSRVSGD
jgi:hypothetical protein